MPRKERGDAVVTLTVINFIFSNNFTSAQCQALIVFITLAWRIWTRQILKCKIRICSPSRDSRKEDCDEYLVKINSTLAAKMGALPLWVWARSCSTNNWRRVLLVPNEQQRFEDDDFVHVSQLLWFNLNSKPYLNSEANEIIFKVYSDVKYEPKYAKEVGVVLMASPSYESTLNCKSLLDDYFSTKRYLRTGDIFMLKLTAERIFLYFDQAGIKPCNIYFLVKFVTDSSDMKSLQSFYVDKQNTTLFQVDTAGRGYIPIPIETGLKKLSCLQSYSERLSSLIRPCLHSRFLKSSILITGPVGVGKSSMLELVASELSLKVFSVNCSSLVGDTVAATELRLKNTLCKGASFQPCLLVLRDVDILGREKDSSSDEPRLIASFKRFYEELLSSGSGDSYFPTILVGVATSQTKISADLARLFTHQLTIDMPNQLERLSMLRDIFGMLDESLLEKTALRTSGFVLGDFVNLMDLCRVRQNELRLSDGRIRSISEVFEIVLEDMTKLRSDLSSRAQIPNVRWDEVGGLEDVKRDILDTIQLPFTYPHLFTSSLKRSGLLLYGPPGTGKTLLAKAVATECSLNFISVKGPELLNMYVGQSEDNIRQVFKSARESSPCIVFFDELDSLAPNRGRSGDSGGVMDRVVSQLLAEMDGLTSGTDVFVIGATNRPDLIDSSLLRPGRMDKLLYVGVSEDRENQFKILKALTKKSTLAPELDLRAFCELLPLNLTGADLYALCTGAMMSALSSRVDQIEKGIKDESENLILTEGDFRAALDGLTPSVSTEELARYSALKNRIAFNETPRVSAMNGEHQGNNAESAVNGSASLISEPEIGPIQTQSKSGRRAAKNKRNK